MTADTLHRTNLNLYAADVAWLTHTYGYGWTQQARDLLHMKIEEIKDVRITTEANKFYTQVGNVKDIPDE